MRVDLRYVIPVVVFYLPGLMLLIGGWMLGFSLDEMRESVAGVGALLGFMAAMIVAVFLSVDSQPIWWTFRKEGRE